MSFRVFTPSVEGENSFDSYSRFNYGQVVYVPDGARDGIPARTGIGGDASWMPPSNATPFMLSGVRAFVNGAPNLDIPVPGLNLEVQPGQVAVVSRWLLCANRNTDPPLGGDAYFSLTFNGVPIATGSAVLTEQNTPSDALVAYSPAWWWKVQTAIVGPGTIGVTFTIPAAGPNFRFFVSGVMQGYTFFLGG